MEKLEHLFLFQIVYDNVSINGKHVAAKLSYSILAHRYIVLIHSHPCSLVESSDLAQMQIEHNQYSKIVPELASN